MADSHTCPANPAHTASVRLALPTEATAIAEIQQRAWTEDPDLAVLTNEVSGTDARFPGVGGRGTRRGRRGSGARFRGNRSK